MGFVFWSLFSRTSGKPRGNFFPESIVEKINRPKILDSVNFEAEVEKKLLNRASKELKFLADVSTKKLLPSLVEPDK